ncbi:odorant receptor 69 isoform X1 [Nasonia vitripennis]|uniref:Odorant receptor n=1 Tax=Nasonia vitripennis TaxID=7425 RepID=A0A7M6UPL7_NASVI|nr:odorant receptor 69 [Nasonia vitripennis]XP_031781939.1 odorant receptor 69 isoform X1 [Nasonia vitripennis]XP_031781940.1 odorant receptor 69 isoform X1 [Nasonia vitripennis]
MKIPMVYWPLEYTLRINGLWPGENNILGSIVTASGMVLILPFQVWDAIKTIDNPILLMDSLSDIMTEIALYAKLIIMWFNRRYVVDVLKEISNDCNQNDVSQNWTLLNYNARRFCKYDYSWYISATLLYYIQLVTMYIEVPVDGREMLLKSYYPFDYKSSPTYEIMLFLQIILAMSMAIANAMTESLFIVLILHACSYVDLLLDEIKIFSDNCNKKVLNITDSNNMRFYVHVILKRHIQLLESVKKIENIYSNVSLVQMFFSVITICVTGFVMITALESKDIVLLIKFATFIWFLLWQIFSFCFAGQYLLNKGETITGAMYDSDWYNIESNDVKAISFIIKKTQRPLSVTAGKYIPLSVTSFAAIVKTSFSYLSVLRASYVE